MMRGSQRCTEMYTKMTHLLFLDYHRVPYEGTSKASYVRETVDIVKHRA